MVPNRGIRRDITAIAITAVCIAVISVLLRIVFGVTGITGAVLSGAIGAGLGAVIWIRYGLLRPD